MAITLNDRNTYNKMMQTRVPVLCGRRHRDCSEISPVRLHPGAPPSSGGRSGSIRDGAGWHRPRAYGGRRPNTASAVRPCGRVCRTHGPTTGRGHGAQAAVGRPPGRHRHAPADVGRCRALGGLPAPGGSPDSSGGPLPRADRSRLRPLEGVASRLMARQGRPIREVYGATFSDLARHLCTYPGSVPWAVPQKCGKCTTSCLSPTDRCVVAKVHRRRWNGRTG